MRSKRAWIALALSLVLLCLFCAAASAAAVMDPGTLAAMKALVGQRDYTRVVSGLRENDSSATLDWLQHFSDAQVGYLVNTLEDINQISAELPAIAPAGLATFHNQVYALSDRVSYYMEIMEETRYRLSFILEELEDPAAQWTAERKARNWQECEVLYQRLKALNAEFVNGSFSAGMQADYLTLTATLDSPAYQALLDKASDPNGLYAATANSLTAQEMAAGQRKFDVVILSDKEIGFSVTTIENKLPKKIPGATVTAWNSDGQQFQQQTDSSGIVRFNISDFKPDESNRAWVKYFVTAPGYRSFGEERIRMKGAGSRNAVLVKDDGKVYASVDCFNGHDISRIKMDYFITPYNDASLSFVVRVENMGAKDYWVMMRYGGTTWGYAIDQKKVNAQNPVATFTNQWAKNLPKGYQIWFYIIDKPDSWGERVVLNNQFFTKPAPIPQPIKPKPEINPMKNISRSFGDAFVWLQNHKIEITPFTVKFNAFVDVSGSIILQFGYEKLFDAWKTNDQKNLDDVWDEINKSSKKDRNAMLKGMLKDSFKNKDRNVLGMFAASISATGSLKGTYHNSSGRFSVDGGVAVKLGLTFDIKKTFWAGIPFILGADFGLSGTLDLPVFQLNWDLQNSRFISAHFQMADASASLQLQAGLSAGVGVAGVAGVTIRGYATGTMVFKLRRINAGPEKFTVGLGLEARAFVLFASYTLTIAEASWDLISSSGVNLAATEAVAVLGAVTPPTPEQIAAQTTTWLVTADELTLAGESEVGGAYIEKKVAEMMGNSGSLMQGFLVTRNANLQYYYYVTMEVVNLPNFGARSRLVLNRVTADGNTLTHQRQVLPLAARLAPGDDGYNVQAFSMAGGGMGNNNCKIVTISVIGTGASLSEMKDYRKQLNRQRVYYMAFLVDNGGGDVWSNITKPGYMACESLRAATQKDRILSRVQVSFDAEQWRNICIWTENVLTPQNTIYGTETTFYARLFSILFDQHGQFSIIEHRTNPLHWGVKHGAGDVVYEIQGATGLAQYGVLIYFTTGKATKTGDPTAEPNQLHVLAQVGDSDSQVKVLHFDGCYTSLNRIINPDGAYRDVFCMEKIKKTNGEESYVLTKLSPSGTVNDFKLTKKTYGIRTNTPKFSLSPEGASVTYVNWMNSTTRYKDPVTKKDITRYQEMGARYDPKSDRFTEPYEFAQTELFPVEYMPLFVFKGAGGGGNRLLSVYATLNDQKEKLDKAKAFQLRTHVMEDALKEDLLNADAYDPILTPGEQSMFFITVKNVGTLPINTLKIQYSCDLYPNWKPTVVIDCQHPLNNQVTQMDKDGNVTRVSDYHSVFPYRSSYDFDEGQYQTTVVTTYDGNGNVVGTPVQDTKYYTMLMPATTRSYNLKLDIPKEFKPTGKNKMTIKAEVVGRSNIDNPMVGMVTIVDGKEIPLSAAEQPEEYITYDVQQNGDGTRTVTVAQTSARSGNARSTYTLGANQAMTTLSQDGLPYIAPFDAVEVNAAYNDLTLNAELLHEDSLGYYIDATVLAHAGINSPDGKTTIHLNVDGEDANTWEHTFVNPITERYGYNLLIPLDNVINGRGYRQLRLGVMGNGVYNEMDENDNYEMLTNASLLEITREPESVLAAVGKNAAFSVEVAGGQLPYAYQWQTLQGEEWVDIPDANHSQLTLATVTEAMIGRQYRCVITDAAFDFVTTRVVSLYANPPLTGDASPVAFAATACLLSALWLALCAARRRKELK